MTIILLSSILLSIGCQDDDEINDEIIGDWRVVLFLEDGSVITKTEENTWNAINNGDITLTFTEVDSTGRGEISGIRVSNRFFGHYVLSTNDTITFESIGSTLINEPECTSYFRLSQAERYEIKNSNLHIFYNGNNNGIVLERI